MTAFRNVTEPLTEEQMRAYAPSIFSDRPHPDMSDRYSFVPTSAVLAGLRSEGFLPYHVQQSASRGPDGREFARHMVRMRHAAQYDAMQAAKRPGHHHFPARGETPEWNEIVLTNSHDGSAGLQLMPGRFRLACWNGAIAQVSNGAQRVSIKHSGERFIHDVIEGATRVLDDFELIDTAWDRFRRTILQPDEALAFAEGALDLKYGDERAPIHHRALLNVRRAEDKGSDLWTVFNVVQENLLKGGIRGVAESGRRMMTRPITGIAQDIDLNRRLWGYAEDVVGLVEAV